MCIVAHFWSQHRNVRSQSKRHGQNQSRAHTKTMRCSCKLNFTSEKEIIEMTLNIAGYSNCPKSGIWILYKCSTHSRLNLKMAECASQWFSTLCLQLFTHMSRLSAVSISILSTSKSIHGSCSMDFIILKRLFSFLFVIVVIIEWIAEKNLSSWHQGRLLLTLPILSKCNAKHLIDKHFSLKTFWSMQSKECWKLVISEQHEEAKVQSTT